MANAGLAERVDRTGVRRPGRPARRPAPWAGRGGRRARATLGRPASASAGHRRKSDVAHRRHRRASAPTDPRAARARRSSSPQKSAPKAFSRDGPCRDRTCDLRIKSTPLQSRCVSCRLGISAAGGDSASGAAAGSRPVSAGLVPTLFPPGGPMNGPRDAAVAAIVVPGVLVARLQSLAGIAWRCRRSPRPTR